MPTFIAEYMIKIWNTLNKQKLESQHKIQSIQDSLLQLIPTKQSAIDSLYQIQNDKSSLHQQ